MFQQIQPLLKENTFLKDEFILLISSTKTIVTDFAELQLEELIKAQTLPTLNQLEKFLDDCHQMLKRGKEKGGLSRIKAKTISKDKYSQRFAAMHEELNRIRSSLVS